MKINNRRFENYAVVVFAIAIAILVWYMIELYYNGILGFGKFDIHNIENISPFFSNIFLPIITIVSLILVYANLLEFRKNNERTIEDKKIEFTSIQVGNYFKEIQPKLADAANKGLFNGIIGGYENYFNEDLSNIYTSDDAQQYNCIKSKLQTNHADLLLLIGMYEYISSNLLNKSLCDLDTAKNIIGKQFTEQLKINHLLGFISYYRISQSKYAENTLLLYKKWDGELGHFLDNENFEEVTDDNSTANSPDFEVK